MSETIERLRNAVGMLRDADGAYLDDDGEYASVESAERQYVAALAAVEQEIAELRKDCDVWEEAAEALEAERDELRKDADRWRELRGQSGLSVNEDGQVDLFALVADSTEAEDAPWLTDVERRALDGDASPEETREHGIRNGWVWKAEALDRAVDALIAAEKAASPEADPATAAGEG